MFFERLQFLCNKDPVKDVSGVLKTLGLSTSKGTAWKNGAIPKGDVLLKLANYFHVSTDYLLGNTDDPSPAGQKEKPPAQGGEPLDPVTRELLEIVNTSTPVEREMMLDMIRVIKKQRKE